MRENSSDHRPPLIPIRALARLRFGGHAPDSALNIVPNFGFREPKDIGNDRDSKRQLFRRVLLNKFEFGKLPHGLFIGRDRA